MIRSIRSIARLMQVARIAAPRTLRCLSTAPPSSGYFTPSSTGPSKSAEDVVNNILYDVADQGGITKYNVRYSCSLPVSLFLLSHMATPNTFEFSLATTSH